MKHLIRILFLLVLSGVSLSAVAHHSFAALYHTDREITIEGRVVLFAIRNPHSFLHVTGVDENGASKRWAIEWGAPSTLSRVRETLKPGDDVVVTGNPGRDPEANTLKITSIERPVDGWSWAGTVE